MDNKTSIINIQDLGLSAASQHSVGGQPILRVIFRIFPIFRQFLLSLEKKFLFLDFLFLESFFKISVGSQYPQ
jgi:hypothetical protein